MTITNMKRNIRNGLFKTSLLGVALVAATSCLDWTEVESLELNAPTLESQNPELYAQYLQSLVDFKNSDHQVVIASFNNHEVYLLTAASIFAICPTAWITFALPMYWK